jgi:hypothetical protein
MSRVSPYEYHIFLIYVIGARRGQISCKRKSYEFKNKKVFIIWRDKFFSTNRKTINNEFD